MRWEAPQVLSVELAHPEGADLPAWEAGSHIDVHLPNGVVRQYSLSNQPGDTRRYVLGVLNEKVSRGGSRCVHQQLRVGERLTISAPRNNFPLAQGAAHSVLVAGGIGLTPILAMARRLVALGQAATLLYCARSAKDAAFVGELQALAAASSGKLALTLRFDDEAGGPPDLQAFLKPHAGAAGTHVYGCGPAPMLDAFVAAAAAVGLPPEQVHIERFAPAEDAAATSTEAYVVELANSGQSFTVPAGEGLLDFLLAQGVNAPHSCRSGICGTCETGVLGGEVDHRDSVLTDAEKATGKTMMICVSGCKRGPLVLAL